MQARRPGRCAVCPGVVVPGQSITKTPAGWVHVGCAPAAAAERTHREVELEADRLLEVAAEWERTWAGVF
jgi:hypothetical protein